MSSIECKIIHSNIEYVNSYNIDACGIQLKVRLTPSSAIPTMSNGKMLYYEGRLCIADVLSYSERLSDLFGDDAYTKSDYLDWYANTKLPLVKPLTDSPLSVPYTTLG